MERLCEQVRGKWEGRNAVVGLGAGPTRVAFKVM